MSRTRTPMASVMTVALTWTLAACGSAASSVSPPPASAAPTAAVASPSASPTAAAVASPAPPHRRPTVIRVASVEAADKPEGKAITTFAVRAEKRTGGSVTVLPIFETSEGDGVNIDGVQTGLIDMAVVQARAWDAYDVTTCRRCRRRSC